MFTGIPRDYLHIFWPKVAPILERVLSAHHYHDATTIFHCLNNGEMQLWAEFIDENPQSVAITEIVCYSHSKICRVLYAAGVLSDKWIDYITAIEQWAAVNGCNHIEVIGRGGWERFLSRAAYDRLHVVLHKELGK